MTTTVKWYTDAAQGAPVLSGTAGALIGILDATLVNGFGLQSVSSLVVAGGVATMSVATTPSATVDSIVLVAGATPSGLNGEQRVTAVTSNSISFATALGNQTATGSITTKMAPAGWAKVFSGINLAVYRSPNATGTRQYLRVDDTDSITATMRAYESMSDVSTGVDKWMDNYWFKSSVANSTAVPWAIFADDKTFYLRMAAGNQDAIYPFGDFNPVRANDPFASCGPAGYLVATNGSASNSPAYTNVSSYGVGPFLPASLILPRSATFLAKSVTAFKRPEISADVYGGNAEVSISSGNVGAGNLKLPYPNTSDNALVFTRFNIFEISNMNFRGSLRGVFCSPQYLAGSFALPVTEIAGQGAFSGRKIGVVKCNGGNTNGQGGYYDGGHNTHYPMGRLIVDLTGPW